MRITLPLFYLSTRLSDFNTANSGLKSFWNLVSSNTDRNGKVFVSTLEGTATHCAFENIYRPYWPSCFKGINYPVYALQWHAEKPLFEWDPDEVIPHNADSTVANQYIANFYVSEGPPPLHLPPVYILSFQRL